MLNMVMMDKWSDDVRLYSVLDTVVISGEEVCSSAYSNYVDMQYYEIYLTFTAGSVCLCGVCSYMAVLVCLGNLCGYGGCGDCDACSAVFIRCVYVE